MSAKSGSEPEVNRILTGSEPDMNRKWVGSRMRAIYKRRVLALCDFYKSDFTKQWTGKVQFFLDLPCQTFKNGFYFSNSVLWKKREECV